jgi:hypothetical protein
MALTDVERQVLEAALRAPDTPIEDHTVAAIAGRADLDPTLVHRTLQQLSERTPALAHEEVDTRTNTAFWIIPIQAADELEAGE